MRPASVCLALVALVVGYGCAPIKNAGPACSPPTTLSAEVLDAVNVDRAAAGVAPVEWDGVLGLAARDWAQHMADTNTVAHVGTTHGDNVLGRWPCVQHGAELEAAWMASPDHRRVILDARWSSLGFGWTVNGLGLWAVQWFDEADTGEGRPDAAAPPGCGHRL